MLHEVTMKQGVPEMAHEVPGGARLISLSVRVTPEEANALRRIADRNSRPVAAQMRWLIRECIRTEGDNDGQRAA